MQIQVSLAVARYWLVV